MPSTGRGRVGLRRSSSGRAPLELEIVGFQTADWFGLRSSVLGAGGVGLSAAVPLRGIFATITQARRASTGG